MPRLPSEQDFGRRPEVTARRPIHNTSNLAAQASRGAARSAEVVRAKQAGREALAPLAKAVGDAHATITARKEGLARDTDENAYVEALNKQLRDAEANGTFGDESFIAGATEEAAKLRDEILSNHQGSAVSAMQLQKRMEKLRIGHTDRMTAKHIEASNTRLSKAFDSRMNSMAKDISEDPDVILAEDPAAAFRSYEQRLMEELDFLGIESPSKRRAFVEAGKDHIVGSMLTNYLVEQDYEGARALLQSEYLAETIDANVRQEAAGRIRRAELELNKAADEGEAALAKARAVLGPNATDEEVRAAAARAEGLAREQNIQTQIIGNRIFGFDKNSGALIFNEEVVSAEEMAKLEGEMATMKMQAKLETINQMAQAFGLAPIGVPDQPETQTAEEGGQPPPGTAQPISAGPGMAPPMIDPPHVAMPFGEGVEASTDFVEAQRYATLAHALYLADMPTEASGFMQRARFMMENSPEIARNQELDKPLSPSSLQMWGLPAGATMRDALGMKPISQENQTRLNTLAREQAKGEFKAQEQVGFIGEAQGIIQDLKDEIDADPGIVGARGSMRAAGQTALGVVSDLGLEGLVELGEDIAMTAGDVLGIDAQYDMFESPTLSALDMIQNSLGMIWARIQQPDGRLLASVIDRSMQDMNLKGLKSSEQIQNRLDFIMKRLDRRAKNVKRKFQQGGDDGGGEDGPSFTWDPESETWVQE